jgi:hypothetical protein
LFESLAKRAPNFWRIWFNIGILVGLSAMIVGICVMIMAGWKLLMGMIGSLESSILNDQINNNSSLHMKFVKRSGDENYNIRNNNNEDHQVFIPVVSVIGKHL